LFQGLPRSDLERIAQVLRGRSVKAGELIFREGDAADRFYIVYNGAVELLRERPRGEHEVLAVRRSGEGFGEMALLTEAQRTATARALEPTNLLVVMRQQFAELLGGETFAVRLLRILARALRTHNVRLGAREVAPGASPDTLRDFNRALHQNLLAQHLPLVGGFDVAAGIVQDDDGNHQALWCAAPSSSVPLFAVMDMKGTSLPPAHLLAVTRSLLFEVVRTEEPLGTWMTRLNEALTRNLFEGLDACVDIGLLGFRHGIASICIGGQEPGIVVRSSGVTDSIGQHGPALGILPSFDYPHFDLQLDSGDAVMLFSQGDAGLMRGAADLLRARQSQPVAETAAVLRSALGRAHDFRKGNDMAFVLARKI
ncbi:MAG TPA: cyclic nucleotide-binding domain-containing protein, partial [Longimicrobiales bacterium]|nr:cyclic nucleotide-binding domain-containing protein [Longimicrobiales bacterium]